MELGEARSDELGFNDTSTPRDDRARPEPSPHEEGGPREEADSRSETYATLSDALAERIDQLRSQLDAGSSLDSVHAASVEDPRDATFEIRHPDLGSLRVSLSLMGGVLDVRIEAPSRDAARQIAAVTRDLSDSLGARGVRIGRVRVEAGGTGRARASSGFGPSKLNVEA